MLFATTELVARVERAECQLLADCAEAIAQRRPDSAVDIKRFGGGIATYTGPDSPLNKVAGLGFEGPIVNTDLEAIEAMFGRHRCHVQVELSCLADRSIGELLTRRGYLLQGFENVLGRALPAIELPTHGAGIDISVSPEAELATWLDVVVTGFETPDTEGLQSHESVSREVVERVVGDMASAPGFVRYLANLDGVAVGAGSMRIFDGVAQLCGAATIPSHRRRGVQTALLAGRLEEAGHVGCDIAVVTTQPASKSQHNVQRQGFELLYTRAVLVRPPSS